jgi:hypothetical protein
MMKCVFYFWSGQNPIVCKENAPFIWKGFSLCEHHIHVMISDREGCTFLGQRMD